MERAVGLRAPKQEGSHKAHGGRRACVRMVEIRKTVAVKVMRDAPSMMKTFQYHRDRDNHFLSI